MTIVNIVTKKYTNTFFKLVTFLFYPLYEEFAIAGSTNTIALNISLWIIIIKRWFKSVETFAFITKVHKWEPSVIPNPHRLIIIYILNTFHYFFRKVPKARNRRNANVFSWCVQIFRIRYSSNHVNWFGNLFAKYLTLETCM